MKHCGQKESGNAFGKGKRKDFYRKEKKADPQKKRTAPLFLPAVEQHGGKFNQSKEKSQRAKRGVISSCLVNNDDEKIVDRVIGGKERGDTLQC